MEEDSEKIAATFQAHGPESWASQAERAPLDYPQTSSCDNLPANNTNNQQVFGPHRYFIGGGGINAVRDQPAGLTASLNNQLPRHPREIERDERVGSWIQHSVAASGQEFPFAPTMDAAESGFQLDYFPKGTEHLWEHAWECPPGIFFDDEAPKTGNAAAFVANSPVSGVPPNFLAIGQDGAKPLTASPWSKSSSTDYGDNGDGDDDEVARPFQRDIAPDLIDDFSLALGSDFARFKHHLQRLNPGMSKRLTNRIAHQQVIRYKSLLTARVNHMLLGGNCPCRSLCLDLHGAAIALDRDEALKQSNTSPAQRGGTKKALTNIAINANSFPLGIPLPPTTSLPAELECQLCYLPQRITDNSDWIKHVHQDVQPYTCTWDDCTDPRMFSRQADWLRHENEEHRHFESWTCDVDSCKNKCYRKDDAQHLEQEHQCRVPGRKTRELLSQLRKADPTWQRSERRVEKFRRGRRRAPVNEPCKFCARRFHSWLTLTRHLARHMEEISLPVIRLVDRKAKELAFDAKCKPGKEREFLQKFADDLAKATETSSFAQPINYYHPLFSLAGPNESIEQNEWEFTDWPATQMPHFTSDDCAEQDAQTPSLPAQDAAKDETRGTNVGDSERQINVNGGKDSINSRQSLTPPRHSLDSEPLRLQASSSGSCDETTSTDEWPSLSMEDASDVDVSKHISQETRSKALLHFLNSFVNWRRYPTFRECGAGTAQQKVGVAIAAAEPSLSKGSTASLTPLKRKQGNNEEEDEYGNGSRKKKTPNPRATSTSSADEGKLLFACPFYKWKPLSYRPCRTMVLKAMSRVKQHLWRCHEIPIYCPRCFSEFSAEDQRDTHIREVNCEIQERKVLEGVTSEQKAKLTRRVNTKISRRKQWYAMYTILFNGEPLPNSPYISEGLLSQELTALEDFMAKQWPTEFELFIANGGIPPELKDHEDVLQAFSASLFKEAVGSTMRKFEEWQQKNQAASSNSGYKSESTPQQEEPNDEEAPASSDPDETPVLPIGASSFATDDGNGYVLAVGDSEQLGCDQHSEFNTFEALVESNMDEYGDFLGSFP